MNKDELQGGARYLGGKVEETVGGAVNKRDLEVDGIVDQVAGGAQHTYGRVKSVVEDAIDAAPELANEAREHLEGAGKWVSTTAQQSGREAVRSVRETPVAWIVGAAAAALGLAWFIAGRRD
jgi:uncharacterized protein YjbJ (UPF0337 family)